MPFILGSTQGLNRIKNSILLEIISFESRSTWPELGIQRNPKCLKPEIQLKNDTVCYRGYFIKTAK